MTDDLHIAIPEHVERLAKFMRGSPPGSGINDTQHHSRRAAKRAKKRLKEAGYRAIWWSSTDGCHWSAWRERSYNRKC